MEVAGGKRNKTIVFIYEAIGTGLLLYAINIQKGTTFGQFGIAFMLFAMILIGGPITGGHFNPAVTLGVYISNVKWREDWQIFLLMLFAQFFGALWGVCLAWNSLYNPTAVLVPPNKLTRGNVPESEIVLLYPADQVSNFDAFQIEALCTFVFVMMCLLVKTGKTKPTKQGFLSSLAVASTLLAMIVIAGPKTGAALNPAVGFAQTVFEIAQFGVRRNLENYFWVYILGPFNGGLVAGILWRGQIFAFSVINPPETTGKRISKLIQ